MWEIEVANQLSDWWSTLSDAQREAVTDQVDLLAERGPDLGRPVVDRIHSSRHQSMKELRATKGGALRVMFSFDPRRQAIGGAVLGEAVDTEWVGASGREAAEFGGGRERTRRLRQLRGRR